MAQATYSGTGGRPDLHKQSGFDKEFLDAHNDYRKKHGAPPLTLSRELSKTAQAWADHLLSIKTLQHSETENGENVYYAWSSAPKKLTGKEAVDSWYSEIKDYDFNNPGFQSNTGKIQQDAPRPSPSPGYFEKNVLPPGAKPPVGASKGAGLKPQPGQRNGQQADGSAPAKFWGDTHRASCPPAPLQACHCDVCFCFPAGETGGPAKPPVRSKSPSQIQQDAPRPSPSPADTSRFQNEALEAHNARRRLHAAPPLRLDPALCRQAQEWADRLLSLRVLQHSDTGLGENIWHKWSSNRAEASGEEAVESWYGEIKDYDFSRPGFSTNTGHFTQVVWRDSQELGIAKATDGKGMAFVVARYQPAGNITNAGYFEKNVLPPGAKPPEGASRGAGLKPQLQSRPGERNGQQADGSAPGKEPVDSWYSEIKDYNFSRPGFQSNTGHFTQVVWKSSLEVGVGQATDGNTVFVVGQYSPAGNISNPGYFEKNVLPLGTPGNPTWSTINKEKWMHVVAMHGLVLLLQWDSKRFFLVSCKPQLSLYQENIFFQDLYKSHFTQLVWRSSQELGVGLANSGTGSVIVVAQFHPAGNITNPGYYSRNVLPKGSKVTDEPREEDSGEKGAGHPVVTLPVYDTVAAFNNRSEKPGLRFPFNTCAISSMTYMRVHLFAGSEVAESWYKESSKYDFGSPGFKSGTGNFSQMVWKSSREVGTGLATDGAGMFIAVVFFSPAGNITNKGYFEDNVKPKGTRI
nr:PREDICTED: uncharacterized protein LOC102697771 [Lepisosteus oculatus]